MKDSTHERDTIPQVSSPHAVNLDLVLHGHHVLDERRYDGVPEVGQHQGDSIRRLGRDKEFAISPRSATEEGPEFRIVFPLNLNSLEVGGYLVVDFRRFNEDGSIFESNEEVRMEERVVRDVGATQVEGIRWGSR